jgi:hypothetical protein
MRGMEYARVLRDEDDAEAADGEPEGGLAAGRTGSLGKWLRRMAVVALITALASLAWAGLGPATRRVAFLLRVKTITDAQAARLCSTLGTAAKRGMDLHISYTNASYSTMVDGKFATFRPAGADADRDIVMVLDKLAQQCAGTIFAGVEKQIRVHQYSDESLLAAFPTLGTQGTHFCAEKPKPLAFIYVADALALWHRDMTTAGYKYSHVWNVEPDVGFTLGAEKVLWSRFSEEDSDWHTDLLTHVWMKFDPGWYWARCANARLAAMDGHQTGVQVQRFSRRLLDALLRASQSGAHGHCERAIASIAATSKLSHTEYTADMMGRWEWSAAPDMNETWWSVQVREDEERAEADRHFQGRMVHPLKF